uniref:CTLH domain-containing protein n=1 Tax=Brassica oleracea var. oleracea TaxID=109376 RepID=A0A0D3AAK9_BRAOL
MSLFRIFINQDDVDDMATSKKVITREEWEKKLNAVKLRKEDMNTLVMNFLVTEAEIDLATITDRMAVKKAVQNGNVEDAIEKVNDLNPEQAFLQELEKTVALLVFEDASNCPVKDLLDISQRLKTTSEVNAAILTSQSHEKDPKLPSLLKMLIWAQNQLDEKPVYPHINDLSTGQLEDPPE